MISSSTMHKRAMVGTTAPLQHATCPLASFRQLNAVTQLDKQLHVHTKRPASKIYSNPIRLGYLRRVSVSAVGSDDAGADGIVFGKPQAPKELFEAIARNARTGLIGQVQALLKDAGDGDVVLAALHLAAEDDAIKTRTHIPLPVDAFSQRLDNIVTEVRCAMPQGLDHQAQLQFITNHLFNTWGLKVAKTMGDGLYSPYRVYMHQVLAQRCGTQIACAAVLHSLLHRLKSKGHIQFDAQVVVPSDATATPIAVLATSTTTLETQVPALTGCELIVRLLDQLKRFYWSWNWPVDAVSGFDACAHAFLEEAGRSGKVNPAVGVMQAVGRPYGDVTLAMLASERLCLITKIIDPQSLQHHIQVRDYATQLMHVGDLSQGVELITSYTEWLQADGVRKDLGIAAPELSKQVLLDGQRRLLEQAMEASAA